mmetsp:Transcript_9356/g.28884  ORF Transcript_9356/g.28884 Transcript_9356/m.28884 type:complete len:485 (-) Transcript_9356:108-1562(-)
MDSTRSLPNLLESEAARMFASASVMSSSSPTQSQSPSSNSTFPRGDLASPVESYAASAPHSPPSYEKVETSSTHMKKSKQHPRRRPNARRACTFCRDAHTACDNQRPCSRCVRYGRSLEECRDAPRNKGKKRHSHHSSSSSSKSSTGHPKKAKKECTDDHRTKTSVSPPGPPSNSSHASSAATAALQYSDLVGPAPPLAVPAYSSCGDGSLGRMSVTDMTPVFPSSVDPDIWFGGERVPDFDPLLFTNELSNASGLSSSLSTVPSEVMSTDRSALVLAPSASDSIGTASTMQRQQAEDHQRLEQLSVSNARLQTMVTFLTTQLAQLQEDLRLLKQHPGTLEMMENKSPTALSDRFKNSEDVAVARFDINTGRLLETNHTFARLVGFRPEELKGMSCRLLFPTRCLKARTLCRQFMLEQEADSVEAHSTLLTRTGEEVDVQLTTFCLRTQTGEAAQCLLLCTPIAVLGSSESTRSSPRLLEQSSS